MRWLGRDATLIGWVPVAESDLFRVEQSLHAAFRHWRAFSIEFYRPIPAVWRAVQAWLQRGQIVQSDPLPRKGIVKRLTPIGDPEAMLRPLSVAERAEIRLQMAKDKRTELDVAREMGISLATLRRLLGQPEKVRPWVSLQARDWLSGSAGVARQTGDN